MGKMVRVQSLSCIKTIALALAHSLVLVSYELVSVCLRLAGGECYSRDTFPQDGAQRHAHSQSGQVHLWHSDQGYVVGSWQDWLGQTSQHSRNGMYINSTCQRIAHFESFCTWCRYSICHCLACCLDYTAVWCTYTWIKPNNYSKSTLFILTVYKFVCDCYGKNLIVLGLTLCCLMMVHID